MPVTNILFVGNCQSAAVADILNLNRSLFSISNIGVHFPFDQNTALGLIEKADIIITQRIVEDNHGYARTSEIIKYRKKNTPIIIYNPCYMKLYYFDSRYLHVAGQSVDSPCSYHFQSIINSYQNSLSVDECCNLYIENRDFLKREQLQDIFDNDIKELRDRFQDILELTKNKEKIYHIDITDFIRVNFKKHLLFYSFNHPANILLQYIAENICKILDIKTSYRLNIEALPEPKCILYHCLSNILEFDTKQYKPYINGCSDLKSIINDYYKIYATHIPKL